MGALALEIGCEEIPARFLDALTEGLQETADALLRDAALAPQSLRILATPRRLVLLAEGIPAAQPTREEWIRGPSRTAAFDETGRPTAAAQGFARSRGVTTEDLVIRETPQGAYVFARQVEAGKPATEVLPGLLLELLQRLPSPVRMRWGETDTAFVRPVRWLLALWDDQVLDVEFGGIRAGRTTRGHRTLAPGPHAVPDATSLPAVLKQARVLADPAERERVVREGAERAAASVGGRPVLDPALLREVVHLVEWPTPFVGRFHASYLRLPEKLLVTTMQAHQRYFPVRDADGKLLPYFVAVRNGDRNDLEIVRKGNEKVLGARLADADFFFEEDRKRPLASYVQELEQITFLERFGSMLDRTRRLERLTAWLADECGITGADRDHALRAAHLSKADLATQVVVEWPELEGVMGEVYARDSGEPEPVARALSEQYLPRPGEDAAPASRLGLLLALADRLDLLAGGFVAGLEPTGSQDPYGLRRQASALLFLLREGTLRLPLSRALAFALEPFAAFEDSRHVDAAVRERLEDFCRARLQRQLRDAGFRPDLIEAVLAAGWQEIPDVWMRAEAGRSVLMKPEFDDLYTAYRRAYNLSRRHPGGPIHPDRFQVDAERELYDALQKRKREGQEGLRKGDYAKFFTAAAQLRGPVDRFLEDVFVMAEDQGLRENRLALLREVWQWIGTPLDLSRLAVRSEDFHEDAATVQE